MLQIQKFEIEGPLLITPRVFKDDRGFFVERYNSKGFLDAGLPVDFLQDNFSRSIPGVLRGLHYQHSPSQLKLVTCLNGTIQDIIVDLRKTSRTFGRHINVTLSGDQPQWFLVPAGFAHGFTVTSRTAADVLYKVDQYYNPATEGSIKWDDRNLALPWINKNPSVSPKDTNAKSWEEFQLANPF